MADMADMMTMLVSMKEQQEQLLQKMESIEGKVNGILINSHALDDSQGDECRVGQGGAQASGEGVQRLAVRLLR